MSTGQTLLTLLAIVLLAVISLNIRQMYLQSVETTVETQEDSDAINYGRDIVEDLQSYAYNYWRLVPDYGSLDDVNDKNRRLKRISQVGKTYYSTVELSDEKSILHGQAGRTASVKVYERTEAGDGFRMIVEYKTAILPISSS